MSLLSTLARCAALGVGTGIRSTAPAAILSYAASRSDIRVPSVPVLSLLGRSEVAALLGVAALAEAAADATLPLPARTSPGPLVGRMAIGAVLAVVLAADDGQPVALGAGVGALSAAWGSFASTGGRKLFGQSGVPDIAVSLLEDAQAALLGAAALRRVGSAVG